MSKRKFVREIKAKEVKNLNPSDIIYLAMKDGSIILIADDDEDTIEYDDLKLDISYKRKPKEYKTIITDSSLYSLENENERNYKTNASSNNFIDNRSNISSINSRLNQIRDKNKIFSKNETQKNKENEGKNKIINFKSSNQRIRNEKLDKSFDDIKIPPNNLGYHEIEYVNQPSKNFHISKYNTTLHERSKSNNNYIINNNNERKKRNYKTMTNDNIKTDSNHLINVSDLSFDASDRNTLNRTPLHKKRSNYTNKIEFNKYIYDNNTLNKANQMRSKSTINVNPKSEKTYYVKRKEMEIMGRIVNDTNSYNNIDHHHPNTLFDPKCIYCQNLARENKINISNIKVESIYDNYSFLATFGYSDKKKEHREDKNNGNGKYYM